jgi:hypothetical protein
MRYTYMNKRGGNMKIMMLMECDMKCKHITIKFNPMYTMSITFIGNQINRKLYQLKPIEFDNMIRSKNVVTQNSIKHHKCIFITFKVISLGFQNPLITIFS